MPWAVAAAGITYVGMTSAADTSAGASDRQLSDVQRKEQEWKDMYGDLEQNLADYYTNLTPDQLKAEGLQAEAESFAKAHTAIQTNLAQRNMQGSGLEADIMAKQEIGSAENKAAIRKNAETEVRTQQQQFLQGAKVEKQNLENRKNQIIDTAAENAASSEQAAWQSVAQIVGAGAQAYGAKQPTTTNQIQTVSSGTVQPIASGAYNYTPRTT